MASSTPAPTSAHTAPSDEPGARLRRPGLRHGCHRLRARGRHRDDHRRAVDARCRSAPMRSCSGAGRCARLTVGRRRCKDGDGGRVLWSVSGAIGSVAKRRIRPSSVSSGSPLRPRMSISFQLSQSPPIAHEIAHSIHAPFRTDRSSGIASPQQLRSKHGAQAELQQVVAAVSASGAPGIAHDGVGSTAKTRRDTDIDIQPIAGRRKARRGETPRHGIRTGRHRDRIVVQLQLRRPDPRRAAPPGPQAR